MNRIEKMTFINLDNIQKGRNAFMGYMIKKLESIATVKTGDEH